MQRPTAAAAWHSRGAGAGAGAPRRASSGAPRPRSQPSAAAAAAAAAALLLFMLPLLLRAGAAGGPVASAAAQPDASSNRSTSAQPRYAPSYGGGGGAEGRGPQQEGEAGGCGGWGVLCRPPCGPRVEPGQRPPTASDRTEPSPPLPRAALAAQRLPARGGPTVRHSGSPRRQPALCDCPLQPLPACLPACLPTALPSLLNLALPSLLPPPSPVPAPGSPSHRAAGSYAAYDEDGAAHQHCCMALPWASPDGRGEAGQGERMQ
jgi:hypothetical protein